MSRTTLLAGGVGGARLARGLAAVLAPEDLTIVVNTGDDDRIYGVHVAADLDTVMYTLAGIVGPQGWGVAGDTFQVMEAMDDVGVDTSFRLGDRDLAMCLRRTEALDAGMPLSVITGHLTAAHGVEHRVLPASDDPVRTVLETEEAGVLAFQDYFVRRGHRDTVRAIRYVGVEEARPAPGVIAAIEEADHVVVAPSNPPLSIHPILEIPGIRAAVAAHPHVVAVSPLFGGAALKGPADRVMMSLGYDPGTAGVLQAYEGLLERLVVDEADADDMNLTSDVLIQATDTHFAAPEAAARFATWLLRR